VFFFLPFNCFTCTNFVCCEFVAIKPFVCIFRLAKKMEHGFKSMLTDGVREIIKIIKSINLIKKGKAVLVIKKH